MQVKNFIKFGIQSYIPFESKEKIFNPGNIVINNNTKNIGVIQSVNLHNNEVKTDEFGIQSINALSLATLDEVKKYRNNLLHQITKKDLFYNSL